MEVLWVVTFGMFHKRNTGGDYSYWDYNIALETFRVYQQMGWDYVSLTPLRVYHDEDGFPHVSE